MKKGSVRNQKNMALVSSLTALILLFGIDSTEAANNVYDSTDYTQKKSLQEVAPTLSTSAHLTTAATLEKYTISTYVTGLPSSPAGLTVAPRTHTFYYADYDDCEGVLRKIDRDGTVAIVSNDFTPNNTGCAGNFYPYRFTDLQFVDNSIYVSLAQGELTRIDLGSGTTAVEHTFADFSFESGITAKGTQLLVTSGKGTASEIQSYDTVNQSAALLLDVAPLTSVFNVKYSSVTNKIFFWSSNTFHMADYGDTTVTPLAGSYSTGSADFEVTPDGEYLVATNNQSLDLISIADGSVTPLYDSMQAVNPRHDMVFAPSTTVSGCSLYVVNGTDILEVSGFSGQCGQFPWMMYRPAMTGKDSTSL